MLSRLFAEAFDHVWVVQFERGAFGAVTAAEVADAANTGGLPGPEVRC